MVNSVNTITIQCDVSGAGNPLCRVMFMLFNAINAFNTCKPHQRSAHSLGVVQHRFGFGLDLGFVILDLVLLLLLISSFHTIRIGQLCRNSIVDEFYLQDIKLMLYWYKGPYDRSIFSSLYLGRLGIGLLWVWDESRPLVKCNGIDHWRTSFTKSCSRMRDWDGSIWFLMKQ